MSARHIEQHYGFGAARIAIRSEMHRVAVGGFRGDLDAILAEAGSGGPGAVFRRFAGTGLGVVALLTFVGIVVVGLVHEEANRQDLEVVMMESPPVLPPPPAVPPMQELPAPPEPVVAEPVVPEPVAPKPVPPPVVAEAKPEPPKPEPPKVEPVRIEPEIAKVTPPPVERTPRPVREVPKPVARPRVQIEAVAVAQERVAPLPAIDRAARPSMRPEARIAPRMEAPAAPAIDVPDAGPDPDRSFRVAANHAAPSARARAIPGVAPAGLPAPDFDAPTARSAPTRASVARPSAPAPTRPVPRFEMAAATAAPPPPAFDVPKAAVRTDRAAPTPQSSAPSAARPGLSGVPLGELQACVTDQEEDRLKQAVVAAAKTQGECVSSKGTYRFVETKNLNAFLMWIDRAPSRRVEDRCAELRYALDCLQSNARRASR